MLLRPAGQRPLTGVSLPSAPGPSVPAGSLAEGELAELLRAAVDLKHRRLAAECLPLLLPSLGRGAVGA